MINEYIYRKNASFDAFFWCIFCVLSCILLMALLILEIGSKNEGKSMKNRKVIHSISRQFTGIFIALMAGTILLCWFLNITFLEDFYISDKKDALLNAYDAINYAAKEDKLDTEEFELQLQSLCSRYNMDVLVLDVDSQTVKYAGNDPEATKMQLWDNLFLEERRNTNEPFDDKKDTLEENDAYRIKIVRDRILKNENIEMWGTLDNGNLFLIRTALESIRDSVRLANRFLAYIGILTIIASGIIIWLVSKKITKPILQLAAISEKMTHLDFDARYNGKDRNEIAVLGENINKMSAALEETISELKTANNELKKDIAEKTEIDEMRKEFLSNVSHELKTPIALIQGYAEGLQEGISDDEESREWYCDVIKDEAAKMNVLVQKLLTLNQLEFGKEPVAMERFDLITLVKNQLQSVDILLKQNNIKLQMQEYETAYVWADEFKIGEVVSNYLSNAIHHCSGDKIIDIRFREYDGKIRVTCFNTGQPIPEESIGHVWEKFYKVDKARTREYGGSGIGLSIVKAIMESMHQSYGVDNYTNGAAFWFELELQEKIAQPLE